MTKVKFHPKEMKEVILSDGDVSLSEVIAVAKYGAKVLFSQEYRDRVNLSRKVIEKFLNEERVIYGVTTGFGSNVTKSISQRMPKLSKKISSVHMQYLWVNPWRKKW